MITETTLLWLGTMALLADYVGIARAENALSQSVSFAVALVLWLGFTANSLAYTNLSGGLRFTFHSQSLRLIGTLFVVGTLILLFKSAFEAFKEARTNTR